MNPSTETMPSAVPPTPPALEMLDAAIAAGNRWLVAQVRHGGRLRYGVDRRGRETLRYNVARHAGTLYALAQHAANKAEADTSAASRVSEYLSIACLREVPGQPGLWAPWCDVEGKPKLAKLGAAGLALAAWHGAHRIGAAHPPLEILQGIGRFIVAMQREDGRFVSKYDAVKGPDDRWQSLYYPGEAALGLICLHAIDRNPLWLQHAEQALHYLSRTRAESGQYEPDHWALLATAALWPHARERDGLRHHAIGVVRDMLLMRRFDGALTLCGGSTPTSTRLEGLLAVRDVLQPDDAERAEIDDAAGAAIRYLIELQIRDGDECGGFPRAPEGAQPRARELRVDYCQHALSAMIAYRGIAFPDA